jgi:hypothetical protein
MGSKADAGTFLKFAGDAGGGDDDSDSSDDGRMRIEGYADGGDGGNGKSGKGGSDGLDLDLGGREVCGDGSDGDGGEDGRMGLEADSGAVSEVEGDADSVNDVADVLAADRRRRVDPVRAPRGSDLDDNK